MPYIWVVFHWRLNNSQNRCIKVSHLFCAYTEHKQCEAIVKLLGSFRLTVGTRHLYRDCIFTEQVLETVPQSLRHSCTSELHISPYFHMVLTISSSETFFSEPAFYKLYSRVRYKIYTLNLSYAPLANSA